MLGKLACSRRWSGSTYGTRESRRDGWLNVNDLLKWLVRRDVIHCTDLYYMA